MKRKATPIANIDDPRYVKALAHPVRIRILAMLEEQPASPVQLSERLPGTSLGAIAYHVRTLLNLELLELVATRQRRGATEHVYRAIEHPRFTDESWEALGPVAKQRLLSAMLQQIGEYTSNAASSGGFDRADTHITRTALKLDELCPMASSVPRTKRRPGPVPAKRRLDHEYATADRGAPSRSGGATCERDVGERAATASSGARWPSRVGRCDCG